MTTYRSVLPLLFLTTIFLCPACSGVQVGGAGTGKDYSQALKSLTLTDLKGAPVELAEMAGNNVIMVSFWATFCKPCKAEMPFLQQLYDKYYEQGLRIVSISLDSPDTEALVKPYIERNRYTFPVCIDRQSDATIQFNSKSVLPFLVIIDRKGKLALKKDGFSVGDQGYLENLVKGLLEK